MAGYDQQRTDLLLQYVLVAAAQEDEWRDRELGPIHLLKYAYIGDLAHARRRNGEGYTGAVWQFYHFGPWQAQVHERIEPALARIGAARKSLPSSYEGDFIRFFVPPGRELDALRDRLETELPLSVSGAIREAVHQFGSSTPALLRHVYTTSPMVSAAPGELLNLRVAEASASRAEQSEPAKLSSSQKRRRRDVLATLRDKVQQQLAGRAGRHAIASPSPRYDDVFAAGTEWLDATAGERLEPLSGDLTVSHDVWKSPTRTESDVS